MTSTLSYARRALVLSLPLASLWASASLGRSALQDAPADDAPARRERPLRVEYLEILTPEVEATCEALEALHGVTFSKPETVLGGSRTATLAGGGRLGVRAPMHEAEDPVVRPYALVDDLDAAITQAEAAGAEFAMKATEIPGQGRFAIYFLGGIQHGLWER